MENKIKNKKKSIILKFDAFSFEYDRKNTKEKTIQEITFNVYENKITSIIGPSGCGKSTLLFAINRLHELKSNIFSVKGNIYFHGQAIYPKCQKKIKSSSKFNFFCIKILNFFKKKQEKSSIDPEILRKKIGLVFQKPTPFATSIYENIVFALKMHGQYQPKILMKIVEKSLKNVNLWEEVKDRLYDSALSLSGGQQQRLCIARCLANEPEIILMDEPTSALDPLSKEKIENLLWNLKKKYTIILVTHSLNQAAKISDYTIFIKKGKLIEFGKTKHLFTQPKNKETLRYLQRHNLEKKRQNVKKTSKNSSQKDKIKNGVNSKNDF